MLTLSAPALEAPARLPAGYTLQPAAPPDCEALGRLYVAAHEPGIACDSVDEATADVAAA